MHENLMINCIFFKMNKDSYITFHLCPFTMLRTKLQLMLGVYCMFNNQPHLFLILMYKDKYVT